MNWHRSLKYYKLKGCYNFVQRRKKNVQSLLKDKIKLTNCIVHTTITKKTLTWLMGKEHKKIKFIYMLQMKII